MTSFWALIYEFAQANTKPVAGSVTNPAKTEEDAYSVYFLKKTGDINNDIVYVGRVKTSNFNSRMSYHSGRGRELSFSIDGLDYGQCRFLEQTGMIWCHTISTDSINNQIRGISPTNPKRFAYFEAGKKLAENGSWLEGIFPISYWANQTENVMLNGFL